MANVAAPIGLKPVRYLSGAPYNGACNAYTIPASDGTAVFIGDAVKLAGTGTTITDNTAGLNGKTFADVIQAASGDVFVGVVVGFEPLPTNLELKYRAASTLRVVYVADDPNLIFEAQETASGTALTANDVGLNTNLTVVAGNTTTGISKSVISNGAEATTNTLDLKIFGFVNRDDNEVGAVAASWLVRLNRHSYVNQIAGV